ncbi:hypothetical protein DL96DRAFT_1528403 [Flagelloscypha sp. PMI_526]|nr:hypothetical protein DL96DRAFT_1528403 [Flagelloscypha sp. PMI_526]
MLSQSQVAPYFDKCTDDDCVSEILSAYVVCKFLNGSNCAQVLQKIQYLCQFLRVTGRGHILRIGEQAFKVISFEVAVGLSERIGATPATTPAGKEIWNYIRQKASRKHYTIATHQDGGPGTIPTFVSPDQQRRLQVGAQRNLNEEDRPAWMERYYSRRRSVFEPVALALPPEYQSRLGTDTLPVYVSQEIADGVRNVEVELEASRVEVEV